MDIKLNNLFSLLCILSLYHFVCFRYLYFTETGSFPRIIRAKLDGSERENFVVSQLKTEYEEELPVLLPEGLAIDFAENMLYWCDRRRDVIEKVNITSRIRKVVVSSGLVDCRALAVYGDYVYWADQWVLFGGSCHHETLKCDIMLFDLKVFETVVFVLQYTYNLELEHF